MDDAAKEASPELREAQAEIARAREKVNVSLVALKREIAETTDWRQWVRKRPLTALAVAFGAGYLLGRRN